MIGLGLMAGNRGGEPRQRVVGAVSGALAGERPLPWGQWGVGMVRAVV
jgi:hypothetical protein